RRLNEGLLGDFNTERALEQLRELGLVRGEEVTRLGQIAAQHFLSPDEAEVMVRGIEDDEPLHSVLAELDSIDDDG
ncbi:MAG: DEAD/DEAH box helicase, partial [Halobacteria archaeon]|nr:DEAD/DEAH box helicase [Halobacteria archaeon]